MSTPGADWVTGALHALRAAGYRSGGAREAVISLLGREGAGMTAQEIIDQLRERDHRVGTASVYRALAALVDVGALRGLDLGQGATRYELVLPGGEHHHHLVCTGCGRTEPFDDPELEQIIQRVERDAPYRVQTHDVILRGLCPRCGRQVGQPG